MALKLTFAVNVPVKGQRYSLNEQHEGEWVPCIWHRDLSFNLCEVCGSQIIDRRRSRTCSNQCTETYWKHVREAERNNNCRPYFWNTFRYETLRRDGHRCTQCGSSQFLEVHHILPIHAGGANAPDNLTTLCHECHAALHTEERRRIGEVRRKERTVAVVRDILEQHGGKTIEEW